MFDFFKDNKPNWPYLRQILYVTLFTWLVGVRLMGINPFDDFGDGREVTLATMFDFAALVGIYAFAWHVMWPARPRIS